MNQLQNSQYSWNILFFRKPIWVLLELVRRRSQNFIVIDQEKHKIKAIYIWTPCDRIFCVNTDLRHQYGISVAKSLTLLLAKRPWRRGAMRKNGLPYLFRFFFVPGNLCSISSKPSLISVSGIRSRFFGKRNWFVQMVSAIPGRNLPVGNFVYHLPKPNRFIKLAHGSSVPRFLYQR